MDWDGWIVGMKGNVKPRLMVGGSDFGGFSRWTLTTEKTAWKQPTEGWFLRRKYCCSALWKKYQWELIEAIPILKLTKNNGMESNRIHRIEKVEHKRNQRNQHTETTLTTQSRNERILCLFWKFSSVRKEFIRLRSFRLFSLLYPTR